MLEIFGFIALVTTMIGLFPQVYKTYVTKSAQDLSMLMLGNYLLGSIAWIVYAVCISDQTVLWANILCATTAVISIGQKVYYGKRI